MEYSAPEFAPGDEPKSRVDWVYSRLRHAIVQGEFEPGAPLRHSELSQIFGVSLIPIREAIRKLEMERLVESTPNKGARVAPISGDEVRDVYSVRLMLEELALRRAVDHVTAEDVEELRTMRKRMLDIGRRDDPRYWERHRDVHFGLYEKCGSNWLMHMIEVLWSHTERHRLLASRVREFASDVTVDFHGELLDCVAAGDADGAADALRRDLLRTSELVASVYDIKKS